MLFNVSVPHTLHTFCHLGSAGDTCLLLNTLVYFVNSYWQSRTPSCSGNTNTVHVYNSIYSLWFTLFHHIITQVLLLLPGTRTVIQHVCLPLYFPVLVFKPWIMLDTTLELHKSLPQIIYVLKNDNIA